MALASLSAVVISAQLPQLQSQTRRADKLRARALGARQRGFTMAELLTVVAFIGILAAASAPSFVRLMRDRRVDSAATQMLDLYRLGRSRAMGRGAAVVVRFDNNHATPSNSNPAGHFTMREAIVGTGNGANLPASNCFGVNWTDAGITSRFVVAFDERRERYKPAQSKFFDRNGTEVQYAELCFTPRGRTFVRFAQAGVWTPLIGVPRIQVTNTDTQFSRFVILPPNGVAQLRREL